ncbi:MAG: sigma 54-interacting transcriptional regulator [Acidobacteriota bacterium]
MVDPSQTRTDHLLVSSQVADQIERRQRTRARVPALTILFHPSAQRVGDRALLTHFNPGRTVEISRLQPVFSSAGPVPVATRGSKTSSGSDVYPARTTRPLADVFLSRTPLIMERRADGGVIFLRGKSRIRLELEGEPLDQRAEVEPHALEAGLVMEVGGRIVLLLHYASVAEHFLRDDFDLVGASDAIDSVRQEIFRVADLEVPVLLRGETGTGKELVARAIHDASRRRQREYLTVNMAAVPASLAASELFGAVKGAYTGADKARPGFFQRADTGTLFLDEVGDTPPEVQVMLLRVLETGEVQRVGSQTVHRVDVRLIAATDADLDRAIAEGSFRAPLLHRLSGYEIFLPPLRQRREDIGRLIMHFLGEELRVLGEPEWLETPPDEADSWMPASVMARLARYSWPGNVRQLRNISRQLAIASRGSDRMRVSPEIDRLLREASRHKPATGIQEVVTEDTADDLDTKERDRAPAPRRRYRPPSDVGEQELMEALRRNRWQVKPTAEDLGISRPSLYVLMDKCAEVRKAGDLDSEEILAARDRHGGDLERMVEDLEVSAAGLKQRATELGLQL